MSSRPKLKDRLREQLRLMMSLDVAPRKMALTCALGVLIGMSPYVGFHTYLAIACSTLFRMPIYPLMAGAYITNPFTIPFIYALTTKLGMWLLDMDIAFGIDWSNLNLKVFLNTGKALLIPFIVGTHVAGAILSVFTYIIVYYIMKRYKGRSVVNAAAGAAKQEAGSGVTDEHDNNNPPGKG